MFVSTARRSTETRSQSASASASAARAGVVVGQARRRGARARRARPPRAPRPGACPRRAACAAGARGRWPPRTRRASSRRALRGPWRSRTARCRRPRCASASGTPRATAALGRRAPSMCTRRPELVRLGRDHARQRRRRSRRARPSPCACSRCRAAARSGRCDVARVHRHRVEQLVDVERRGPRCASPRGCAPQSAAAPPASSISDVRVAVGVDLVARARPRAGSPIWLAIVPGRMKSAASRPHSCGGRALERVDGLVLAVDVVADAARAPSPRACAGVGRVTVSERRSTASPLRLDGRGLPSGTRRECHLARLQPTASV